MNLIKTCKIKEFDISYVNKRISLKVVKTEMVAVEPLSFDSNQFFRISLHN